MLIFGLQLHVSFGSREDLGAFEENKRVPSTIHHTPKVVENSQGSVCHHDGHDGHIS